MQVKRTMLANLKIGEYIDHIVFVNGKPRHLQSEVTKVEIHSDFGRVWTTTGPLKKANTYSQISSNFSEDIKYFLVIQAEQPIFLLSTNRADSGL